MKKALRNGLEKIIPLLLLLLLTWHAYKIFWSGLNMGGTDAQWYQYALHDAWLQLKNGFFPTYVGQGQFNFTGAPMIRAPYYLLLGQLLNAMTFNTLTMIYIQHLTVLFSAFAGALFTYLALIHLAPRLRGFAAALSLLYVSCPGVIALIFKLDMYYSFMTIPYIPIVLYGLIRGYERADFTAYLLTAMGLSLTWMAHPAIAIWLSAVCALFYALHFIFVRREIKTVLTVLILFLLLNLWQWVSIWQMRVGTEFVGVIQHYAASTTAILQGYIVDAFLPLAEGHHYLQLGYSFWLMIAMSLVMFRKSAFALRALWACFMVLLLFLYPLPKVGYTLWSWVPKIVCDITSYEPDQRFYVILASMTCFIGILSLRTHYDTLSRHAKKIIMTVFIVASVWGFYQYHYFRENHAGHLRHANNSWWFSHNLYFIPDYLKLIHHGDYYSELAYDPVLTQRILDQHFKMIPSLSNKQVLIQHCFDKPFTASNFTALPHTHYLLCLQLLNQNTEATFVITGKDYLTAKHIYPVQLSHERIITIPFYVPHPATKQLSLSVTPDTVQILKAGLTTYKVEDLPIHLDSFIPYRATVTTQTPHNYLALFKEFYPGYEAMVDGKHVSVLKSKHQEILIPLEERGLHHIQLIYRGTLLMRLSFYISALVWGISFIYLLARMIRRTKFPR